MKATMLLPFSTPVGAPIRIVDDNHPELARFTVAIEAAPSAFRSISRKFWNYRIWHKLGWIARQPGVISSNASGRIQEAISELIDFNGHDVDYVQSVESVSVIYPKGQKEFVWRQLSNLLMTKDQSTGQPCRSIVVSTIAGPKVVTLLEQCLDIEVSDPGAHVCLNSPIAPAWEAYLPQGGPFMNLHPGWTFDTKELSERSAWERLYSCIRQHGLTMSGTPYPNGDNEFPDYRASIARVDYDVEMTSVPNMNRRTIRSSNRDVEATIRSVAQQPDETIEEIVEELSRVLSSKSKKSPTGRYMLVVSNWSSFDLDDTEIWRSLDTTAFDDVILMQRGKVYHVA